VYETACLWQIPASAKQRIETPVNMRCVYYMPTRRAVDLVNLLEATCDILVNGEVLADDNCRIVATHDGSHVTYDKENPRVEITIEPYTGIIL
jgi:Holliday junction resolvase RusA-like endonuclease